MFWFKLILFELQEILVKKLLEHYKGVVFLWEMLKTEIAMSTKFVADEKAPPVSVTRATISRGIKPKRVLILRAYAVDPRKT